MQKYIIFLLIGGVGGIAAYVSYLRRKVNVLIHMLQDERTRQKSISASYGRITEQWFPLMRRYPYDSSNFRFLGSPVDGVQFEEDRIVFVEFKARTSDLSPLQRRLKELVKAGKVTWEEYYFTDE